MRLPRILIEDIEGSIRRVQDYVGDKAEEEFLADQKTQAAVLWGLIAIGEAAKSLPDEIRQRYPDLPWKGMTATRDFLAHGYYRADPALIWRIVKDDLPDLRAQLQRMRHDLEP